MEEGKIVKGVSGFYYVHLVGSGIYECKAKGVFRQKKLKPLVGDQVQVELLDQAEKKGNIVRVLPRKNQLVRPAVANIDLALVIFAAASPEPNLNLLDRFLVLMSLQQVPVVICFNKMDLVNDSQRDFFRAIYEKAGYPVLFTSARQGWGIQNLRETLAGKTATVAGPSGVGKSSLVNLLQPEAGMETGELSHKIARGKQTTRHTQLVCIERDTYIMDTPGFSSLYLPQMEKEDLQLHYPEICRYEPDCRFQGCSHISEPDCGVKEALWADKIARERYDNYCQLYEEVKSQRKY